MEAFGFSLFMVTADGVVIAGAALEEGVGSGNVPAADFGFGPV